MSNELVEIVSNLPAEFKAKIEADMMKTLHNLSIKTLRLPKIKVGHANQTFSLPNGEVAKSIDCWLVAEAAFMELYDQSSGDEDENKIPICVAISDQIGSRYGDCNKCKHFEWKENPRNPERKMRDCASTTRLLLGIRGMNTPVELKVPQTSYNTFQKIAKEASAAFNLPLFTLDFKITLKPKKEGNQEWSLFEFEYALNLAEKGTEDFMARYELRRAYAAKYDTYFKDAYTLTTTQTSETKHEVNSVASEAEDTALKAAARPNKKAKAAAEASESDAVIVDESNKDLEDLAF